MVATKKRKSQSVTPLTRCSNCLTVFEVPAQVLESADTRVRCGECLSIFDALASRHTVLQEAFAETDDLPVDEALSPSPNLQQPEPEQQSRRPPVAGSSTVDGDQKAALSKPIQSRVGGTARSTDLELEDSFAPPAGSAANSTAEQYSAGRPVSADLDVTFADFDLFSDEAELPEHVFLDDTQEAVDFNFEQVPPSHDETLSDTLFANDVTMDARSSTQDALPAGPKNRNRILEEFETRTVVAPRHAEVDFDGAAQSVEKTVEFDYSASQAKVETQSTELAVANGLKESPPQTRGKPALSVVKPGETPRATEAASGNVDSANVLHLEPRSRAGVPRWLLRVSLFILALLLVAAVYFYNQRKSLVDNPVTRPFLLGWCMIKGCDVPARFDADKMRLMSKNMYSHPQLDNALVINVVLKNMGSFEQRYPVLGVRLSDLSGTVVARRDFYPDDYLKSQNIPVDLTIAPNSAVDISFDIEDPGNNASSFIILPH